MKYDDTEWYRSSRWDLQVEEAFELRLRRARAASRNQYIRIQGLHLAGQSDEPTREIGRALLRRAAYEEPTPFEFDRLSALEGLAESLLLDGKGQDAEIVLREVVELTNSLPTGRSGTSGVAELTIAEILQSRGDMSSLAEANQLLDEVEPEVSRSAMFRNLVFRYLLCRARVAHALREGSARQYALEALSVAGEMKASIPRHPDLGRPDATKSQLAELKRIAKKSV